MGDFVLDNELINASYNEVGSKSIKIVNIEKKDDYLFIQLDNGQNIVTNGIEIYDVSNYNHLKNIFSMQDKLCAVMTKGYYTVCVVDLKTMELLFEDDKAYQVSKEDERTLHVLMKIGGGNTAIYDIETKKYLPSPDNYEFENSLGNNLYVFKEKPDLQKDLCDCKSCVINADGEIILEDITGHIHASENHFFIKNNNELCIIKMGNGQVLDIKTVRKDGTIIAEPEFYNGNLILIEKGIIKICTPDFELVDKFIIQELDEVIEQKLIFDTLKLLLPYAVDREQEYKQLFINLRTGKSISHLYIESYPCWAPTTYVGQDSTDSKVKDYHFYNADFEPIIKVAANSYKSIECNKECMFVTRTLDGENEHKQLLNAENGSIRDIDYDYIHYHISLPYGYGVNLHHKKMDFFDENLNIIIPDFDYQKFDLSYEYNKFNYFIVNNYLCIHKHFVDDFGGFKWRVIIQRADGEIILNSVQHTCYAMGNLIQIINSKDNKSVFLNTITGEIGPLEINASTNENGKIDFQKIRSANQVLSLENNISFKFCENEEDQEPKVKKLIPEWL